ncbi:MAG: ABC transporter permease subunit [Clostridia bacterium]|nr:ABC transporter permease subunit [Clostridia bacterium]
MKANKLAKAEFGKILQRPAIFFMTAFILFTLIILAFCYTPVLRQDNSINHNILNTTVSDAFSAFNTTSTGNNTTKSSLDAMLDDAVTKLTTYNSSSNLLDLIKEKVQDLQTFLTQSGGTGFYPLLLNLANNPDSQTAKSNFSTALVNLRNEVLDIYTFLDTGITNDNVNFYITYNQLAGLKGFFFNFYNFIPRQASLSEMSSSQLILIGEKIVQDFSVTSKLNQLNSFSLIQLDASKINEIINKYYTEISHSSGSNTLLSLKYKEIQDFASENQNSNEPDDIEAINNMFTEYKNIAIIATELINCSFDLQKAGNFSDNQLCNFIGFNDINKYILNESLILNNYLLENKIFDGNYLLNFSLTSTVGYEVSAYDFCFFSMQIISVIIIIFCLFFTVSGLAGEQSSGTLKMLAMRPYNKSKIIKGKILASVYFMMFFIMISVVASFIIGAVLFGVVPGNILLVFNGSFVVSVYPAFVILIYLLCLAFNITLFISIASFISVASRSGTFSVLFTFIIFLCGMILNALCSSMGLYSFLPFAHMDLFKYFGNAENPGVLFGVNMISDGNFFVSLIYIVVLIFILNLFTKKIFNKRDIA